MKITKEMIEKEIGYEINEFKLEPLYENGECVGLGVNVEPKRKLEFINTTITISKSGDFNTDISSKNHLSKDEILSTGDWYEADHINLMEGYLWKHKSIEEDGYVFYMRRNKNDGLTTIAEEGKEYNILFEGYIKNIDELNQIVHLCRLHEI